MHAPFPAAPNLTICDLQSAKDLSRAGMRFSFGVQILACDDEYGIESMPNIAREALRLSFEDILDGPEHFANPADFRGPTADDIAAIIRMGRSWAARPDASMLIHCYAGRSRSTAAAMIVLTAAGVAPDAAAALVLRVKPDAAPNCLMARMADEMLGCGGALLAAATRICAEIDAAFLRRDSA